MQGDGQWGHCSCVCLSLVCVCVCGSARLLYTLYTDDSGVLVGFSIVNSSSLIFDSGSISIRLALYQTTISMINAKNIMPAVVPVCSAK